MKKTVTMLVVALSVGWYGCSSDGAKKRADEAPTDPAAVVSQDEVHGTEVKEVTLSTPLDGAMVKQGQGIYEMKCSSCHKLDETRLVGPGWKGVMSRRKPEWIMNMILNVDMMLEKDAEAQKMLELCLVRMPNQNLSEPDARSILEFMRMNDGEK
ncbi:c-type cytochrome [Larkinella punicea]|uniref:Cytochrome c n=1 Tax=Larkinella punicea TaxID=2315727 RepID=A0A368JVP1_9BACT|nr:c-type cytochrome [Larkinella punicea]RCR71016.1 cytochrome c [Larkinella punicea]